MNTESTINIIDKSGHTNTKLTRRSKRFTTIISAIEDKKGEDILSIDLKKIPEAICDFFILCTVVGPLQTRAVIDNIEEKVKIHCQDKPVRIAGEPKGGWMVIDYVDIIIHVFSDEIRSTYNLEELWSDGIQVKH